MSVENKIRELLEGKKQLSEEVLEEKVAGDSANPKQGSSEASPSAGKMGADKGKDTSIPAKVAGDQTQPRQGDSKDAPVSSTRDDETENPGAKEAAPVSGSNQGTVSQKGAGKAPNFTDEEDPRNVVNQASSKGNVAKEEVETTEDEEIILEDEIVDAESTEEVVDISSLFDGNEELSEEFRTRASSLFEAVVTARVNDKVMQIEEQLVEESAKLVEDFKAEMIDKLDSYMNYVVEKWLEENKLAVENGLRNDITESFINGMKNLFAEHYIDVPEEKYDVLGEMQTEIATLKAKLDEQLSANVELHNNNIELQKDGVFASVSEGLAKTEVEKFKSLVADVEFENAEIFEDKLNVIKENYFPKSKIVSEDKLVDDDVAYMDDSTVSKYVEALNKMAKN
jgi:hypothetical protein